MAIGLIGGSQAALGLGLSFIAGRLLDAGWSRWVAASGSLLICIGYGGLGLLQGDAGDHEAPTEYGPVLALQGVVAGIGLSCLYMFCSQLSISVSLGSS